MQMRPGCEAALASLYVACKVDVKRGQWGMGLGQEKTAKRGQSEVGIGHEWTAKRGRCGAGIECEGATKQ